MHQRLLVGAAGLHHYHTHTYTGSVCLFLYNNDSLTSKEDQGLHSESEHKEVKEGGGEGRRPGGNGKRK